MTNGEMFKRIFGLEFNFAISCDDIDCTDCPYCLETTDCLDKSDRERGIAWAKMEIK